MPKLKTHSGTKDRVKVTKNGKVRSWSPQHEPLFKKKVRLEKEKLTEV